MRMSGHYWFVWGFVILMGAACGGFAQETAGAASETTASAANASASSADAEALDPAMRQKLDEALEKFKQSDIAGALETLQVMAASDARLIPPRLILAQWFAQLQNQNAVRVSLEMATEETPGDPEAYLLLGEIAMRQGEMTAAELLYQKSETLLKQYQANPERQKRLNVSMQKNKVALARARSRWTQMQEALGALLKLEGETPETCRSIGFSFFQLEKEQPAREWFARADTLDEGKGLPADAQMAQLYMSRGDQAQAKESLKNALMAKPDSIDTMNLSLSVALNEGDMTAVDELTKKLYAADPKNPNVLKTCGIASLYRGNFPQAEKLFQEALISEPADGELANGLALALCEQNDPEKNKRAIQYATSNLQKQGNNRDYLATYGWVLWKSGDADNALAALRQSAADGQINSAAAYYLAVILAEKGEKENAQKLLAVTLGNQTPFFKRAAAEQLLEELNR